MMSPGSASVGVVVSTTPTSNEPVAVLPAVSVALHDTVVLPERERPGNGTAGRGERTVDRIGRRRSPGDRRSVRPVASAVMPVGRPSITARVVDELDRDVEGAGHGVARGISQHAARDGSGAAGNTPGAGSQFSCSSSPNLPIPANLPLHLSRTRGPGACSSMYAGTRFQRDGRWGCTTRGAGDGAAVDLPACAPPDARPNPHHGRFSPPRGAHVAGSDSARHGSLGGGACRRPRRPCQAGERHLRRRRLARHAVQQHAVLATLTLRGALSHQCATGWWELPGFDVDPLQVVRFRPGSSKRSALARLHRPVRLLPHHLTE